MAISCGQVSFRHLQPDDAPALRLLHQRLFPLDYDASFYQAATGGLDGIVAWAATVQLPPLTPLALDAVDLLQQQAQAWEAQQEQAQALETQQQQSQQLPLPPSQQQQEHQQQGQPAELLVGFITVRVLPALYADPNDRRLLGLASEQLDRERLMYILTLGVAEPYQRNGIARQLLDLALRHAAYAACRAVYLHVASFNRPALRLYRSAGFAELAVLPGFYTITTGREPVPGQHSYAASLFGCIIAPPGPTPWDAANLAVAPLTAVVGGLNACLPWSTAHQQQEQQEPEARVADLAGGRDGVQQAGRSSHQLSGQEEADPEAQLPTGQEQQPQWWQRARPRPPTAVAVPQLGQPPQLQPLQQGSSEAPEWLRALFTRR